MKHKKHLDFELNLIPFIDLLSTCICFLLLTAVWVQVGSMNVKQAVGGQPVAETAPKPVMWVFLNDKGDVSFDIKGAKVAANLAKAKIAGVEGKPNTESIQQIVAQVRAQDPNLATALIQPGAQSIYEDIVDLMDQFKKAGIVDLGVAPL